MSYYMICPNCGKGTIGRYATDDSLCGECSDNSSTTDELSVEKPQEIRVEELKDFNSKILQAELKNQKLQKEIDAAKKYIEESYKADKEDNKLLDLIFETVEKLQEQLNIAKKALAEIASPNVIGAARIPLYRKIASEALAAIGGDDE